MNRDTNGDKSVFNQSGSPSYWFQISDTEHLSFASIYFTLSRYPVSGREAARTINAYILSFLNQQVKGIDDPLPTESEFPRVVNFSER